MFPLSCDALAAFSIHINISQTPRQATNGSRVVRTRSHNSGNLAYIFDIFMFLLEKQNKIAGVTLIMSHVPRTQDCISFLLTVFSFPLSRRDQ